MLRKVKGLWFLIPSYLYDFAVSDEVGVPLAKRAKLDSEEGEKTITAFLASVRELASSSISDAELEEKFEELKLEFLNTDNNYIKYILSSVTHTQK